jgi:hypothetical protein
MKGSTFLCNEKYVHSFVANTVGVAQLIIDIRPFAGKITDNKFGALDQVGDFSNNETRPRILINAPGAKLQFTALVFDDIVYFIHIYAAERHNDEDKTLLEVPFVGWVIIGSAKLAVHESVFTTHNRDAPSSPSTEKLFVPV